LNNLGVKDISVIFYVKFCIDIQHFWFRIKELMTIFSVSRRTIEYWFERWSEKKLVGLYDRKGRGRKSKLSSQQKSEIKEWVKAELKDLKENHQ
jgi:transposase